MSTVYLDSISQHPCVSSHIEVRSAQKRSCGLGRHATIVERIPLRWQIVIVDRTRIPNNDPLRHAAPMSSLTKSICHMRRLGERMSQHMGSLCDLYVPWNTMMPE